MSSAFRFPSFSGLIMLDADMSPTVIAVNYSSQTKVAISSLSTFGTAASATDTKVTFYAVSI